MKQEKPKRGPGRPALDPSGAQVPQSVRLTPAEIEWLRQQHGSVNAGVRALVADAMARPPKSR